MILVDSSVWIDYFRGARNRPVEQLVAWLQGGDATVDLGVADLVVFEVMRGFAAPKEQKRAKDLLLELDVVEIGGMDNALSRSKSAMVVVFRFECYPRPLSSVAVGHSRLISSRKSCVAS